MKRLFYGILAQLFLVLVAIALGVIVTGCGSEAPAPKPSPSPTVSPTPEPTPTPTEPPLDVGALFSATEADKAEVLPMVTEFIAKGIVQGLDVVSMFKTGPKLTIRVASLDAYGASVIGLCSTGSKRTLTLDPDFFRSVSDTSKQLVASHELGHCILYRPHRTDTGVIPDGTGHSHQLSIMYPIIFGASQYKMHEGYYDRELFLEVAVDGEPKKYICGQ